MATLPAKRRESHLSLHHSGMAAAASPPPPPPPGSPGDNGKGGNCRFKPVTIDWEDPEVRNNYHLLSFVAKKNGMSTEGSRNDKVELLAMMKQKDKEHQALGKYMKSPEAMSPEELKEAVAMFQGMRLRETTPSRDDGAAAAPDEEAPPTMSPLDTPTKKGKGKRKNDKPDQ